MEGHHDERVLAYREFARAFVSFPTTPTVSSLAGAKSWVSQRNCPFFARKAAPLGAAFF